MLVLLGIGSLCVAEHESDLTVEAAREEFLSQLPLWKLNTFQKNIYSWDDQAWDFVSGEAYTAGASISVLAMSYFMQASLQNSLGPYFGKYGSLVSDIATDGLTSSGLTEFSARTGVAALSWFVSDRYVNSHTVLAMRYLANHWYLMVETFPDIFQSLLPKLKGERSVLCGRNGSCNGIHIKYRTPGEGFSPDTGRPWLELTFPFDTAISNPENSYELALLGLRSWVKDQGINEIHLYPDSDSDNGHRKLWVRYWKDDISSQLIAFPGQFSMGAQSWWWTDVMAEKNPGKHISARKLINPLHQDILANLPAALSGSNIRPVKIQSDEQAVGEKGNLTAVSSGPVGFLMFDQHYTQGFELPEIWMVSTSPLNSVMRQALRGLDLRRAPAPWRGAWKVGAAVVRASIQRWFLDLIIGSLKTYPQQSHEEAGRSASAVRNNSLLENTPSAAEVPSTDREDIASKPLVTTTVSIATPNVKPESVVDIATVKLDVLTKINVRKRLSYLETQRDRKIEELDSKNDRNTARRTKRKPPSSIMPTRKTGASGATKKQVSFAAGATGSDKNSLTNDASTSTSIGDNVDNSLNASEPSISGVSTPYIPIRTRSRARELQSEKTSGTAPVSLPALTSTPALAPIPESAPTRTLRPRGAGGQVIHSASIRKETPSVVEVIHPESIQKKTPSVVQVIPPGEVRQVDTPHGVFDVEGVTRREPEAVTPRLVLKKRFFSSSLTQTFKASTQERMVQTLDPGALELREVFSESQLVADALGVDTLPVAARIKDVLVMGEVNSSKYSIINWVTKGSISKKIKPLVTGDKLAVYQPVDIDGVPVRFTVMTVSKNDLVNEVGRDETVSPRVSQAINSTDKVIWCSDLQRIQAEIYKNPTDVVFEKVESYANENHKPVYVGLTYGDKVLDKNPLSSRKEESLRHQTRRRYNKAQTNTVSIMSFFLGLSGFGVNNRDPSSNTSRNSGSDDKISVIPPEPPTDFSTIFGSSYYKLSWYEFWRIVLTRDEKAQDLKAQELLEQGKIKLENGDKNVWKDNVFPDP